MSVDSLSSVELTVLTAASASCALVMPFAAVSIWSADVLSSFDSVFTAAFAFGPPIFGGGPSVSRSSASCLLESDTVVAACFSLSFVRLPPLSVFDSEVRLFFHDSSEPQRLFAYAACVAAADAVVVVVVVVAVVDSEFLLDPPHPASARVATTTAASVLATRRRSRG